jgi:hypothetical protein
MSPQGIPGTVTQEYGLPDYVHPVELFPFLLEFVYFEAVPTTEGQSF